MKAATLDTRDVQRAGKWLVKLQNTKPLMHDLGTELISQTQERLSSEKATPDGTPWGGWSDSYAGWRSKMGQNPGEGLGLLSGDMRQSINYNLINQYALEWGSGKEYAGYFNALRQFVGLSSTNESDLVDIAEHYLRKQSEKA